MTDAHFEILVEEPSMEAFLATVLPSLLGERATFRIHVHQGKPDLLAKLEARLRAYAKWLPDNMRVVVLVDRDGEDCVALKARLENCARSSGFATRTSCGRDNSWRVVNRIAVEELEAWYFGDWSSVASAFPRTARSITGKTAYRDSDSIAGGTWEALERILGARGYYPGGLQKVDAAYRIGEHFDPARCIPKLCCTTRRAA